MTGSSLGFPALWLRHNCPCAQCLDPVTGQRLVEVAAIPNGCGVTVEAETAESVTVVFTPDGHRAVFRRAWLAARALPAGRGALPAHPVPGRSPWLSGLAGMPSGPARSAPAASPDGGADAGADPRSEDGKRLWLAADVGQFRCSTCGWSPTRRTWRSPAARSRGTPTTPTAMGQLRLPCEQAQAAYAAYRTWASLAGRPEFLLTLRLAPGDCLVFDNTRVLHARTAFAPSAAVPGSSPPGNPSADGTAADDAPGGIPAEETARERHLQGCYADIDGLLSTLAVLRRVNRASRSPGELVRFWTSAYLGTARPAAGYCPGGQLDGWATGLAPAATVPLSGTTGSVARQLGNGY